MNFRNHPRSFKAALAVSGARLFAASALVISLLGFAVGCNDSPYELMPVSGRVTIDGVPFTAGKVMFAPIAEGGKIDSGKAAFGLLDEGGGFELSTYRHNDGAVVGKHWVTLYLLEDRLTDAHRGIPIFHRLPALQDPVEVTSGTENRVEIDLSIDQVRKYAKRR